MFCADVKGDLAGLAMLGEPKDFLPQAAEPIELEPYEFQEFPVIFWDLFGEQGHPIRATVSEMGPLLLSRLMNLSEAQEGIINIAFRIADEEGLLLLDLKDLQALLANIAERADELSARYGNVTKPSVGAIQRTLLILEQQGADHFFGEPALKISDIMRTTPDGRGAINVLAADKLMMNPRLYATFLLWLLSELFEELPEVGDPDKPKLVFFFDEAHLLFDEAPKILVDRVEQVVRLIRSKGVGVYFVTQNPARRPRNGARPARQPRPACAARLYAARAEGREHRRRHVPAQSGFRLCRGDHPARRRRGAGLDARGQGRAVDGPADADAPAGLAPWADHARRKRRRLKAASPVAGQYDETVDRESAFEMLEKRVAEAQRAEEEATRRDEERETGRSALDPAGLRRRDNSTMTTAMTSPAPQSRRPAARAAPVRTARGRRGGDQVGGALGRLLARPRPGPRHSGQPEEGVLGLTPKRSATRA